MDGDALDCSISLVALQGNTFTLVLHVLRMHM